MGQQQLLIIALSVFVVGIALLGGFRFVEANNQASERDFVLLQMHEVIADAQRFALKPLTMGGGEGSLVGFAPMTKLTTTSRVRIYVTAGNDWVLLQGFGSVTGSDGASPVQVVAQFNLVDEKLSGVTEVN